MALTNPIEEQNVVDRFSDYVTDTANSGIVWGTNSLPFTEMPSSNFAGTTAGVSINPNLAADLITNNNLITASRIYDVLVNETQQYTNIRKLKAVLFVEGDGGNTGSRPTAGSVYDQTSVAHLSTSYRQSLSTVANNNTSTGNTVGVTQLQGFFTNLQTEYNAKRNTIQTIQVDVCHASCHNNCHGSRGRR